MYSKDMPCKNTIRYYDAPAYYHVYNRGAGKRDIFLDDQDRAKFLSLLARHLDPDDTSVRGDGCAYVKYDIKLAAYCLMSNHFHLLVFQQSDHTAITSLMKSVLTAYTMYFNLRYKGSGHLFQGVFKAARITDEAYLLHITRYIHMNPRYYLKYKWSSVGVYLGDTPPRWLHPDLVDPLSPAQYRQFLASYEGRKTELQYLKHLLAL
jgi:REP element-mobilizing transposase RayT